MELPPDILHTTILAQQLVPGGVLAWNHTSRILSLLAMQRDVPHVMAQDQFSLREWTMLVALLEAFPGYVPYERLLSRLTPHSYEECSMLLAQAREQGTMRAVLWPIRDTLKTLRPKVIPFLLMLIPVAERGYLLSPRSVGKKTPYE